MASSTKSGKKGFLGKFFSPKSSRRRQTSPPPKEEAKKTETPSSSETQPPAENHDEGSGVYLHKKKSSSKISEEKTVNDSNIESKNTKTEDTSSTDDVLLRNAYQASSPATEKPKKSKKSKKEQDDILQRNAYQYSPSESAKNTNAYFPADEVEGHGKKHRTAYDEVPDDERPGPEPTAYNNVQDEQLRKAQQIAENESGLYNTVPNSVYHIEEDVEGEEEPSLYNTDDDERKLAMSDEDPTTVNLGRTPYVRGLDGQGRSQRKLVVDNLYLRKDEIQKIAATIIEATEKKKQISDIKKQKSPVPEHPKKVSSRDWNTEYQDAKRQAFKRDETPSSQDWYKMSSVAKQFVDTAVLYAKIIISEHCLPTEEKTIKPVQVGGVAGGIKYVHHGILFKFALDVLLVEHPEIWMYGGDKRDDDLAMKSARNELQGLEAHSVTHVPGLHYPLLASIDYKGFRLLAMSLLPITKETIRYGSNDSGLNIHDDLPELNELMKTAAIRSNLKGHVTGLKSKGKKEIFGPGDIEAHKGTDGNYYVIDFGRVMPPEDPSFRNTPNKREVFFSLLRPEVVKYFPKPLNSDAFTNWNTDPNVTVRNSHNDDVTEATRYLYDKLIPAFAKELDEDYMDMPWDKVKASKCKSMMMTNRGTVHGKGISYRHLGYVRLALSPNNNNIRKLLLSFGVARVIKDELRIRMREKMKEVQVPSDEPFKNVVVELFNDLNCANPDKSPFLWKVSIKERLQAKYVKFLTDEELSPEFDLKSQCDMKTIFGGLFQLCGIKLNKSAKLHIMEDPDHFVFVEEDIKSLETKTRHASAVYFAEGNYLLQKSVEDIHALSAKGAEARKTEIARQLEAAVSAFSYAHCVSPLCPITLAKWGEAVAELANQTTNPAQAEDLYKESMKRVDHALQAWPSFAPALITKSKTCRFFSNFLEKIGAKSRAKELSDEADKADRSGEQALTEFKKLKFLDGLSGFMPCKAVGARSCQLG
eukprot:TRINITY_DN1871_c0_g2_i1.p1 TRINITY_DN1871_c0_g2~~TRINITY_DN1871_c0_g2_i1.p1  ORF type:complete len:983 (-),score=328.43 TRINITY_DN1871_c0_g2_i1:78-3026(-)